MINNIKLYIDGQVVDIDDSIKISLNKRAVDFSNQSTRPAPFTYTMSLPRTQTNKTIFKSIDYIHTSKRFAKEQNYKCDLFSNGLLIISGVFILDWIKGQLQGDSFEGHIVGEIQGLFLDFGAKTLQDLKLPEIDFEGVMFPYQTWQPTYNNSTGPTRYAFATASSYCLNPALCFDMQSLINGFKDPNLGFYGSSIDYTDYYRTTLCAYNNFPAIKPDLRWNVLTNFLSFYDFMPQIIYSKVIEQMFKDLGYQVVIQDGLLTDTSLLLPYFGTENPVLNWLHLSKVEVYTKRTGSIWLGPPLNFFQSPLLPLTYDSNQYKTNQYITLPILNSRFADPEPANTSWPPPQVPLATANPNRVIHNRPDDYQQFTDIVLSKKYSSTFVGEGLTNSVVSSNFQRCPIHGDNNATIKLHYMLTQGIRYDFFNNFSGLNNPSERINDGQVYTCPADGVYEFSLDILHLIRTNQYAYTQSSTGTDGDSDRPDWLKSSSINGYDGTAPNTWLYDAQEMFYAANMVMFVKDSGLEGVADLYEKEFQYELPNYTNRKSAKVIKNFVNDDVIAYYNPMLRDLWTGGHELRWHDYIRKDSNGILVNPNPIPTGSDIDDILYQGFNKETTILEYTNEIGYDAIGSSSFSLGRDDNYPRSEQYKRKLVRTKKMWGDDNTVMPNGVGKSKIEENFYLPPLAPINNFTFTNYADGNVKFRFKTNLKKGEQVRMVYVTVDQFKKYGTGGFHQPYGADIHNPSVDNNFWVYSQTDGPENKRYFDFEPQVKYNDFYVDEYTVRSYKIKCISDDLYSSKLKLANFLPKLTMKEVFDDFLKSNNLYYYLVGNVIHFNRLDDYFAGKPIDISDKIDDRTMELYPIEYKRNIQYGLNVKDNYDFKALVNNLPINLDNTRTAYDDPELQDLSSKLFFSSVNKDYNFRFYDIRFDGGWNQTNFVYNDQDVRHSTQSGTFSGLFSCPSFQEGGEVNANPNDANTNFNKGNYLINYDGPSDLYPVLPIRASASNTNHNQLGFRDVSYLINRVPFYNISPNYGKTSGGYLDNSNRGSQFIDRFSTSDDICTVTAYFNLSLTDYNTLDPTRPIILDNTIYYIQKIENFDPIHPSLTRMYLTKI